MPLSPPSLQLRVSEEYPIVDAESRALLGYINQFPDRVPLVFYDEKIEREREPALAGIVDLLEHKFHPNVHDLVESVKQQRAQVAGFLREHGCRMAIAGTHPDSQPKQLNRLFTWYTELVGQVDIVTRRLQIYSTTIDVKIESPAVAINVMNGCRYLLPHILCLSSSSPFWDGEDTGLKSYRQVLRSSLQRTDLPPYFASMGEYQDYLDTLVDSHCIKSAADLRWDVRLNKSQTYLVFSICDAITRLYDLTAIAALIQCIVAWLSDLYMRNMQFLTYNRVLLMENKWRAQRYGTEGRLIDFGKEIEVPFVRLMWELTQLMQPYADRLGTADLVERINHIAEHGSSADRQRAYWKENDGDMTGLVDFIADASEEDQA